VGLLRDATAAAHQAQARAATGGSSSTQCRTRCASSSCRPDREALARGEVERRSSRSWRSPTAACGYELARWIKDDGTIDAAGRRSSMTEHTGLIVTLDHAMLRQALEAMAGLPADLHVAVNIAGATLTSPDLYDVTLMELARTRVSPQRLHLEVTETSLVHVTGDVLARMRSLAQLGVVWWVDDFGTGYSSIAHLRDMPVRGLKLDRSFTSGIDADMRSGCPGTVGFADLLGLGTVRVETEEAAVPWRRAGSSARAGCTAGCVQATLSL
jgi:EAL domain-containing protein (putative c-di-GMP-specific phosphodiesterase class I)